MANYLCETYIMQWYYCKGEKKRNFCLTHDKRYMYEAHYFLHKMLIYIYFCIKTRTYEEKKIVKVLT